MEQTRQGPVHGLGHLALHVLLVLLLVVGMGSLLLAATQPSGAVQRPAAPASLPMGEELSRYRLDCVQGWRSAFLIDALPNCTLQVILRVRLEPQPGMHAAELEAAKTRWKRAIRETWSDRFLLQSEGTDAQACRTFRVEVQVDWVERGEHHTVQVRTGVGQSDVRTWYLGRPSSSVAHEVGHMLGLADEYSSGICPRGDSTDLGSLMYRPAKGVVRARHYAPFAEWLSQATGVHYEGAS